MVKMILNPKKLKEKISFYKLANEANIPISTVYSWGKSGIPQWRIPVIEEFCRKTGVDISDCYEAEQ